MNLEKQNMDNEPPLCAKGCGFFGSVENMNMCSKCYKECLKEEQFAKPTTAAATVPKSSISSDDKPVDNAGGVSTLDPKYSQSNSKSVKNRCESCKKRVGPLGFECRCGGVFCSIHRYPEEHSCHVDFKKAGQQLLAKQNPICKADKLQWRI